MLKPEIQIFKTLYMTFVEKTMLGLGYIFGFCKLTPGAKYVWPLNSSLLEESDDCVSPRTNWVCTLNSESSTVGRGGRCVLRLFKGYAWLSDAAVPLKHLLATLSSHWSNVECLLEIWPNTNKHSQLGKIHKNSEANVNLLLIGRSLHNDVKLSLLGWARNNAMQSSKGLGRRDNCALGW